MSQKLRLNFNERSDFVSIMDKQYPFDETLWQYPERQPLEKKIAKAYQLSPKQVLCCNGGDEAIMILMRIIKETGRLILPIPAFSQYMWGIESWGLETQIIECCDDLTIDVRETLTAIKETPDSVTIITRPNNPTGELIPLAALKEILETAEANNSWIFLDEAYIEFSDHGSVAKALLERFNNLVVLRTLSKAYGLAGIRLGYLLGSEILISEFEKRCAPFNIAQPTLIIANDALSKDNDAEVKAYCQQIIANRNQLFNWLTKKNISVLPSQANFLVVKLPANQAIAVQSFLERNGILVRSFTSKELIHCLRITIPYKMDDLLHLIKQALVPKLVCLDMDGVLIDTSGSYDATIIETVKQLSGKKIQLEDIEQLKNLGGYNNDWVVAQKLLLDLGYDLELHIVIEAFQHIYLGDNPDGMASNGMVSNETAIIEPSLINFISNCSTIFAIVTGRPLAEANAGKHLVGLDQLDLISLDCVDNPKPSPEGIVRLQQKFSALSWMCGDNPDDIHAAIASNSLAIGIASDNKEILYDAGADFVLNNINELEDWLCPLK